MKPQFKLIDFFQVAPDRKLASLSVKEKVNYIDSLFESESQKGGLSVSWYLSHSGRRINNRIYTVKGQRDGIDSIMNPYAKPILTHHDQGQDPIGRFTGGRWESLASEAMGFFPSLNSYMDMQLAFDRDDPEMIFDLMNRNNLLTNRQWAGMGRMSVSAKISDPTAIEKFMDGRYITFSAGSTTDRHVCSICQSDWAVGDFCDHRHGKMYDGVPCCFVTGKFEVLEASVVNTPADDLSQLQSMEMTDSVENFSLDLKQDVSTLYFSDSIYEAQRNETLKARTQTSLQDNQDLDGKEEKEEAKQESSLFDGSQEERLQQEVLEDKEYDHMLKISSSEMEELHNSGKVDILQTSGNEEMIIRVVYEGYKKEEDTLSSDLNIDKNIKSKELIMELDNAEEVVPSETVETEEVATDSEEVQPVEINEDSPESLTQEDSDLPVEANEATEEQVAQDETLTDSTEEAEEVVVEDCVETEDTQDIIEDDIDIDWDIFDLALSASMQDAALSTEQRNKLPDSAFCGPNRSFPVPDCAHVTAARRLIGRAKLSDAQKAKVLACVDKKANSMSCDKEKDEALTELQRDYATALARVEDLEKKLENALEFVAKYNNKEISFEKDDNRLEVLVTYFDSICEKNNSEAETTPMAVVENPSVDSSDVVTPSKKVAKLGNFEKSVIENYNLIVERDGLNAAEKFLVSQGRYLPRGFHPSKL